MRTALYSALLAALLGLGACGMMQMLGGSNRMSARLSGANEAPAVMGHAHGTLEASFNKRTNQLSWAVTYTGLSGPVTAAHFHGPAIKGQIAGVILPIAAGQDGPIKGVATLTPAQSTELLAGKWVVALRTFANPGGEIRGEVN